MPRQHNPYIYIHWCTFRIMMFLTCIIVVAIINYIWEVRTKKKSNWILTSLWPILSIVDHIQLSKLSPKIFKIHTCPIWISRVYNIKYTNSKFHVHQAHVYWTVMGAGILYSLINMKFRVLGYLVKYTADIHRCVNFQLTLNKLFRMYSSTDNI